MLMICGNGFVSTKKKKRVPKSALTGNCLVFTSKGQIAVSKLIGTSAMIWNSREWVSATPTISGSSSICEVTLSNGIVLRVGSEQEFIIHGGFKTSKNGTKTQRFKRTSTLGLKKGDQLGKFSLPVINMTSEHAEVYNTDAYSQGFYSGDGVHSSTSSYLYEPKYCCAERLYGVVKQDGDGSRKRKNWYHGKMLSKGMVPINASLDYRLNWLAGILDSDGCVTRDPCSKGMQIVSNDPDFIRDLQIMLFGLGTQPKLAISRESQMSLLPDGKGGKKEFFCKKTERILINSTDTAKLSSLGLQCERLVLDRNRPQRDARYFVKISDVRATGTSEEVFSIPERSRGRITANGIVLGS